VIFINAHERRFSRKIRFLRGKAGDCRAVTKSSTVKNVYAITLLVFLIVISLFCSLKAIGDQDFFWHIATGKWIVQNMSLPDADPFSFTTPASPGSREKFILTAYWLSQTLYYALYYFLGLNGIILLRFLMISGILYVVFLNGKLSDKTILLGLTLAAAVVLLEMFPMERPQAVSFLFFSITLYLLARLSDKTLEGRKVYFLFPLVLLVWSNMHPGVVLGQVIILSFLVTEGVKFLHPALHPMPRDAYRRAVVIGIIGILASFINPNTYRPALEFIGLSKVLTQQAIEYLPSTEFFTKISLNIGLYAIPLYWFLLLLAIGAVSYKIVRGEPDVTEIVLLTGLGYFSFMHVRYIPFFLVWAAPVIASFFSRMMPGRKHLRSLACVGFSTALIFYSLVMRADWRHTGNLRSFKTGHWVDQAYPAGAVSFLESNRLEGNIFNFYDWGGYAIWKLYPGNKVFIDGRQLDEKISSLVNVLYAAQDKPYIGELPFYEAALDRYQVRYILMPLSFREGRIIPFVARIMASPWWKPVFFDEVSIVFVKDIPEHRDVIGSYSISIPALVAGLHSLADRAIMMHPNMAPSYITKGDLYLHEGRLYEAYQAYAAAVEVAPWDSFARERLAMLAPKMSR
jgi:hypothetical protein